MAKPSWVSSQKSHIWIFSVGRGISIFIRNPLNQGIMYDFGSSEDFRPSEFLKKNIIPHLDKYKGCPLAQTIVSHPHADHITDIGCTREPNDEKSPFYASLHTCPHHKIEGAAKPEAINWKRIKNPKGNENNIDIYKSLYQNRKLPLQTIQYDSMRSIPNLEYGLYYVRPPIVEDLLPDNDQEYGNGTSMILYYRHGNHTALFTGDLNPDTFKLLLDEGEGMEKRYTIFDRRQSLLHPTWHKMSDDQPSLKTKLGATGLSILVAPHHGLQSGFSEDLYRAMKDEKPDLVVISEKRHLSDKDGKVEPYYQTENGAKGQKVMIDGKEEDRYCVSTRNGHHILILFQGTGGRPYVYLDKNPLNLLEILK
jgi:hypothetical protein